MMPRKRVLLFVLLTECQAHQNVQAEMQSAVRARPPRHWFRAMPRTLPTCLRRVPPRMLLTEKVARFAANGCIVVLQTGSGAGMVGIASHKSCSSASLSAI